MGAIECQSGVLYTCEEDVAGCLDWTAVSSCASGFCGDAGTCGSCSNECSLPARECSAGALRACEADERGCFVWSSWATCPGADCANGEACGFRVGGILSGLGDSLILTLNSSEPLELSADGPFYFSTPLADASAYTIRVASQPQGQQCSVLNSAGVVAGAEISSVRVLCEGSPLGILGAPAYLKASHVDGFSRFGDALAASGSTLAVGAPMEASSATGVNGNEQDDSAPGAGAAYVFVHGPTGWSQEAYIKASNTAELNGFGTSVAVNGDVLAVGAPGESSASRGINGGQGNAGALGSGAVYVFVRQGQSWTQQAYLKASNADASDSFGKSVSLTGTGHWFSDEDSADMLVVGAPDERSGSGTVQSDNSVPDAGAAYVFVREGTVWRQEAYLKASAPAVNARFGAFVAVSGDTLVAGAPSEAGSSSTGDIVSNSGAVHVFERSAGSWSESARLQASNPSSGDEFGQALALSGDLLAVGARHEDGAARGVGGDPSADGAHDSGATYIYTREDGAFSQTAYIKASNASADTYFGASVDLWGSLLVVGAIGEGSGSTGVDGDQADQSVGASGAAYVLSLEATGWIQRHYLKASNPDPGDYFGTRVAISSTWIAVAASFEDSNATGIGGDQSNDPLHRLLFDSGAVYAFPR